jgi:hypothetical protein
MNPKTEPESSPQTLRESEFSPDFIRWLVTLAAATLLLVFISDHYHHVAAREGLTISPYPWVIAGGQTISLGLSEFGGKPLEAPAPAHRFSLVTIMLVVFIVGPTLFSFGWRQSRLRKESGQGRSALNASTIVFVLGGILTLTIAIPAVPAAIMQRWASQRLRTVQAVQRNRDNMINDLNRLAANMRQYRILPAELGGGGNSYAGYTISAELQSTEDATYSISALTPDQVSVRAVSRMNRVNAITVSANRAGELWGWEYEGEFR